MTPYKISRLKAYGLSGLLMVVFAGLATYLPQRERASEQFNLYFGMPISQASVQHEFFNDPDFQLQQLNGIQILNRDTGKLTYYFEYIADKQDTLRRIAAMSFLKDNRISSTACELMNTNLNPLDHSDLTQEERDATSFFWDARANEFPFYECYKSPMKHTLLLSKNSNRILHKVEFV
jgi:hypothetical protein